MGNSLRKKKSSNNIAPQPISSPRNADQVQTSPSNLASNPFLQQDRQRGNNVKPNVKKPNRSPPPRPPGGSPKIPESQKKIEEKREERKEMERKEREKQETEKQKQLQETKQKERDAEKKRKQDLDMKRAQDKKERFERERKEKEARDLERRQKQEQEKERRKQEAQQRKMNIQQKTMQDVTPFSAPSSPVSSPPPSSTSSSRTAPSSPRGVGNAWSEKMAQKALDEKQQERNKIRGRRKGNAEYMDNQIRKIISILKSNGGTISYGRLFEMTASSMDALSAILHTAKKRGVVKYDGVMLMQGKDDNVQITLLKETFEETKVAETMKFDPETVKQAISTPVGPEKCFICSKTVYPAERIAPNSKVMHKTCFRCKECNSLLRLDAYCLNNGKFYCKGDYDRLAKLAGNYNF